MLSAFEGSKGETKTMLPVIREFMAAHALPDVTVVADAGMISDANMKAIEAEGLSFMPDFVFTVRTYGTGPLYGPARQASGSTGKPGPRASP
jgi:hypothetical protein